MGVLCARDLIEGLSTLNDLPEGPALSEMHTKMGERWCLVFTLIQALNGLDIPVKRPEVALAVSDDISHHAVEDRVVEVAGRDPGAAEVSRLRNHVPVPRIARKTARDFTHRAAMEGFLERLRQRRLGLSRSDPGREAEAV
jgi:hypothetical protein